MNKSVFFEGVVTHPQQKDKTRIFTVYDNGDSTLSYELTQGIFTLVDKDSFSRMAEYIWRAQYDSSINSYYALTTIEKNTISLHRYISKIYDRSISVDHKDLNPLNNCLNNLRLATQLQQCLNQNKKKNKVTSMYNGVTRRSDVSTPTFRVRAQSIDGKQVNIGSYKNEIQAAEKWDEFMYEQYKNHHPLENVLQYDVKGEPTINFIHFNFPERLGIK